ncbi:hypothetical protein BJ138DRAFT_1187026, partial [Hygrophoropsis aurantiaca]
PSYPSPSATQSTLEPLLSYPTRVSQRHLRISSRDSSPPPLTMSSATSSGPGTPAAIAGDITPPPHGSPTPLTIPSPPSELESRTYYAGLPSAPILVARTSRSAWKRPTGPEAYTVRKELRTVGNRAPALKAAWESAAGGEGQGIARRLHALLDTMHVQWTSTDVVRIVESSYQQTPSPEYDSANAPVVLWVGVRPASLSGAEGAVVAARCRALLVEAGVGDVEVEIRESVVVRSAGPKLLPSVSSPSPSFSFDPTVDVREPLTAALGIPICAEATATEGTGGFFLVERGNNRLLLVTARHVVLPPDTHANTHFKCERTNDDTQPRERITLFSDATFNAYLESIKTEITRTKIIAEFQADRISSMVGRDDPDADAERKDAQAALDSAQKAMGTLDAFYQDVVARWATPEARALGHVVLAPPLRVDGGTSYTEDWAVIEVDAAKVDARDYKKGRINAIDVGTRISPMELARMMYPEGAFSFAYPRDRLLELRDTIPDAEMRRPRLFGGGAECLAVLKRGGASGLTAGRANDVCSYVRIYGGDDVDSQRATSTSKEWAILPCGAMPASDNVSSACRDASAFAFSAVGDSGAVVADGEGRIGGMLTGGAGGMPRSAGGRRADGEVEFDVSYATPIGFLLERMRDNGLDVRSVLPRPIADLGFPFD